MWSRLLLLAVLLLPAQAFADVKEKVAALSPSALVLVMDADGSDGHGMGSNLHGPPFKNPPAVQDRY
jgi:hypothetical protein